MLADEKLAAIRKQWHAFRRVELYRGDPAREATMKDALVTHIPALLDETERLAAENAALRAIAESLVQWMGVGVSWDAAYDSFSCVICGAPAVPYAGAASFPHDATCPLAAAHAWLDAHKEPADAKPH